MSDIAEIMKTAHDIFDGSPLTVEVDERGLGMAYAIPKGSEESVIDIYGPWHDAEIRQVFYKESSLLGAVLAEIQMILSWRYSAAQQYIIEAYLTPRVLSMDPTTSVKINVRFDNPQNYDFNLEAYEIPFHVHVSYDPIGEDSSTLYRGAIRADGTGSFVEV